MSDDELLTIYDETGMELGVKRRGDVHRDGNWHALVFVWAAWRDGGGEKRMLLQLRGRPDDAYGIPYGGQLDAPAGGHVRAGESHIRAALREFEEEVGIVAREDELVYLGSRRLENPEVACKRVIQHFYLLRTPIALSDTTPGDEVSGFVDVAVDQFEAFIRGRVEVLDARSRGAESTRLGRSRIDAYTPEIIDVFLRSLRSIDAFLETGVPDVSIWRAGGASDP